MAAILFNGMERLGAILVEGHSSNHPVNYFKIDALVKEEKPFEGFSIFSSGGQFVQRRRIV